MGGKREENGRKTGGKWEENRRTMEGKQDSKGCERNMGGKESKMGDNATETGLLGM